MIRRDRKLSVPITMMTVLLIMISVSFGQVDLFPSATPSVPLFPDMSLPQGMEFVTVPSGSFMMGSFSSEEINLFNDERPHWVSNIDSFEIMTTEVTQDMWEAIMGYNPCSDFGVGEDYPVYSITWDSCHAFIKRLNMYDPNYTYRLPTEAEWEYACRAGTTTLYYWGDEGAVNEADSYCWFEGNASSSNPVAVKEPNSWGLYDMIGNAGEWCEDSYTSDYLNCPSDGSAYVDSTDLKVVRGGTWTAAVCTSASRWSRPAHLPTHDIGFRLVRTPNYQTD